MSRLSRRQANCAVREWGRKWRTRVRRKTRQFPLWRCLPWKRREKKEISCFIIIPPVLLNTRMEVSIKEMFNQTLPKFIERSAIHDLCSKQIGNVILRRNWVTKKDEVLVRGEAGYWRLGLWLRGWILFYDAIRSDWICFLLGSRFCREYDRVVW